MALNVALPAASPFVERPFPKIATLSLADVHSPAPNRALSAASKAVYETVTQMGFMQDPTVFAEYSPMSAYLWPYTPRERLEFLVSFFTIGYLIDDALDRDTHIRRDAEGAALRQGVAEKAYRILLQGKAAAQPDKYDFAFMTIREAVERLSTADFVQRFLQAVLEQWHAAAQDYEADGPYTGTFEDYVAVRRPASGVYPGILLIELAQDCYQPEGLLDDAPSLGEAVEALIDIGALSNDLFSYEKEVIAGGSAFNVLAVIQRQAGYSGAEEAARDAIDWVNARLDSFAAALDRALQEASHIADSERRNEALRFLEAYIPGLWDFAAGCFHWQFASNRYRSETSPFPDLRAKLPA